MKINKSKKKKKPVVFSLISINQYLGGCGKILFSTKTMTQIPLKNSFRKVVFHIFAEIEIMRNKIDHWPPF